MANQTELVGALRQCALFEQLSDKQLEQLVPSLYEVSFNPGSFVIKQGESGTELFVIKQGSVEVLKNQNHGSRMYQVATIPAGEVFGELALIDNGYRSASIRAIQPTSLLVLTSVSVNSLDPEIAAIIYKGLATKLSERLRFITESAVKAFEKETIKSRSYTLLASAIIGAWLLTGAYCYYRGTQSGQPDVVDIHTLTRTTVEPGSRL